MKPLRVDEIRDVIPEIDALRPLLAKLVDTARPDLERRWSASGELETVGDRLVDVPALTRALPEVIESVRTHLTRLYELATGALRGLAEGKPQDAVRALTDAAELEWGAGRLPEAEGFALASIELAKGIPDRTVSLRALMVGARIARARGLWREAERRYREAERVAGASGNAAVAARAAVGFGNVAVDRGLWAEALRRYEVAEEWIRRAGTSLPEAWHLALNRSIVAREEGRLPDALVHVKWAMSLVGPTANGARAILDNARGQILLAEGRREEAELVFREALEHASDPDAIVTISANLAEALLPQGRALEAGEILRRAEEVALQRGIVPRLPEIYVLLGRIAAARGHADAFVFFEKALQIARREGLAEVERARVLEAYARHELERGELEAGRGRAEEARQLYRELGNEAAVRRLDVTFAQGGET